MISLVTGHTGTEHVTSKQVGRFNAALHGKGNYILDVGDKCQVDVIDSNKIRINKGELMCQGRHISIESPEEITITGGTLGQTTYALVYIHYSIDDSGIESVSLQTKALTSADNYDLSGSILDGSSTADVELVRVSLNGYSISNAELLLEVLQDSENLKKEILNTVLNESLRIVDAETQDAVNYFRFNNGIEIEFGYVDVKTLFQYNSGDREFKLPFKFIKDSLYLNVTSSVGGIRYYGNAYYYGEISHIKNRYNHAEFPMKKLNSRTGEITEYDDFDEDLEGNIYYIVIGTYSGD